MIFRDLPECGEPIEDYGFCESGDERTFQEQVAAVTAEGGGPIPESALDAIYTAAHSEWRDKCHRAIILFTDAPCYPELDSSTCKRFGLRNGGVDEVINALMANWALNPDYPIFDKLEEARSLFFNVICPD